MKEMTPQEYAVLSIKAHLEVLKEKIENQKAVEKAIEEEKELLVF